MKQKRYWLRGGVIFLSIYALLQIISMLTELNNGSVAIIFYIINSPTWSVLSLFVNQNTYTALHSFFVIIPFSAVLYFIVGSILGWIYGKIKNRNKTADSA
ncbi:MAG: hypothetical protein A3B11_01575 [Candidatus Taylorbacteria bacterium RIFCSPLOWO2_01_FULL_44_26]|uniref:Uncharacterized protein n=2 Tax=Candidatus Tayloriibacteriota TaxID=1817919 RepID=A0A1G2MM15_9BACT|nr:MAG: hypothetical protein A3D50_01570 [Candidatus Taylorbacteria bacterium RIFCSPHIGHO2_02_FULL_44_12]OHA31289.1 MAG: hypothetical protein A3B11_01575 [Candidatus Taylorbacteria bacterium RIFCSPLOWO2_01_FULL_44_26]